MTDWVEVPGYPGYFVNGVPDVKGRKGWVMTQGQYGDSPYKVVTTYVDGVMRQTPVHVLVCRAFHGEPPTPDHEVGHWDGDPLNNDPDNLRWVTKSENAEDRRRHGTLLRGSSHPLSKITEDDVREIRRLRAAGVHDRRVAKQFGISKSKVHQIYKRQSWAHVE